MLLPQLSICLLLSLIFRKESDFETEAKNLWWVKAVLLQWSWHLSSPFHPAQQNLLQDSLLAFNKDSMCCVAAAKGLTNAGWQEVTALYISHWHWQLTDGYHSHTEKKAPRMIRQHYSLFIGATFDWVLLRIINPCRSIAEPVCSQCPDFFSPETRTNIHTEAFFFFFPLALFEKKSYLALCSCLLEHWS